jgi:autotransporter-associated beta strand protein
MKAPIFLAVSVTRRRARTLAITILIGAIALFVPDGAAASTYHWTADGGGSWTAFANWTLTSGTIGPGYPSQPGDVAVFEPSDANRTITINQSISIGQLHISDNFNVFFNGNSNGQLVFDTVTGPAILRTEGTGQHVIGIPIVFADPVEVDIMTAAGRVTCTAGISESGAPRALTKYGPGTLHYFSLQNNTYSGVTTVEAGVLELQHLNAVALAGPLVIGNNGVSAIVRLRDDDQLSDVNFVQVARDGVFELGANNERVGALSVNGGTVTIGNGPSGVSHLVVSALAMIAATIDIAQNSSLGLMGNVSATSTSFRRSLLSGAGSVRLNGTLRTFTVNNGPHSVDLEIQPSIVGDATESITKTGPGTMQFTTGTSNAYAGLTTVTAGRLELARVGGMSIPGALTLTQSGVQTVVAVLANDNISDAAKVTVQPGAEFRVDAIESIEILEVAAEGVVQVGPEAPAELRLGELHLPGGQLTILPPSVVRLGPTFTATSTAGRTAIIGGGGTLLLERENVFDVADGPQAVDLQIFSAIAGGVGAEIRKNLPGVLRIDGSGDFAGSILHTSGQLFINGSLPNAIIDLAGGTLSGIGRTERISLVDPSTVAPGLSQSPGILTTGTLNGIPSLTLAVQLNGPAPGTGYDQLRVIDTVTLNGATLSVTASVAPPPFSRFTLIDNVGTAPIAGTFAGLPEGATLMLGGRDFRLSYTGGDGNDVELSSTEPLTWFLAEGATGAFFDDDVLIANPTTTEAPVTMTFLLEGGGTVVEQRTIAPRSRMTVHVDQIAGLESASPSVQITSSNAVPLVVERTMFWDPTYYGGHTANAVSQPELKWVFAEGFQGFFDTYVLIANANPEATTATITFLRENDTPVVKTVPVGAFARKTVFAGDYEEVVGRAFGIVVEATRPVIAERAMYFASLPGRLWSGGHANTGIASPSTSWFHAEGATGTYFNTFILLSNPQDTAAHVEIRFLLSTGEEITRTKTIEARQRLTINPATEGDARLENAALSTVVESDVPIVSERSMYWPGDAAPFGEGHNSAGMVVTSTHWGLAEGRVGGPQQFQTYILLANPSRDAADVTITFLREGGAAPIVKTYTVPGTSRFNVDLATVPELQNESFGARIDVTNGIDIAVERSLYWNANGVFWAGGTNALATPVP